MKKLSEIDGSVQKFCVTVIPCQSSDHRSSTPSSRTLKEDGQLGQGNVPALDRHRPLLAGNLNPEIKQFQQTVLVREAALGFGQFLELAMNCFDGVGGVYHPENFLRVFEIG